MFLRNTDPSRVAGERKEWISTEHRKSGKLLLYGAGKKWRAHQEEEGEEEEEEEEAEGDVYGTDPVACISNHITWNSVEIEARFCLLR